MMLSSGGFVMTYILIAVVCIIVFEIVGISLSLYRIIHYRRHRHLWGPIIATSKIEGLGCWGTMTMIVYGLAILIYIAKFAETQELKDLFMGIIFIYPIARNMIALFVKGEIREEGIYFMEKIYKIDGLVAYGSKDYRESNEYYALRDSGFIFKGCKKNIFGKEKIYCFGFDVHNDDIPALEEFLYRKGIKKVKFKEEWDKLIGT